MSVTVDMNKIKRKWKKKWEAAVSELEPEDIANAKEDWSLKTAASEEKWFTHIREAYDQKKFSIGVSTDEAKNEWAKNTYAGLLEKARTGLTDEEAERMAARAGPYISLVKWAKVEFNKIKWPDPVTKGQKWIEIIVLLRKAKGDPNKVSVVRSEIEKKLAEYRSKHGVIEKAVAY